MTTHANGGSPVALPQQYHTVPTLLISQAEQHDRCLNRSEMRALSDYFSAGSKRLQIAAILTEYADEIVSASANRIFYGGAPMAYLERPAILARSQNGGSSVRKSPGAVLEALKVQEATIGNPLSNWVSRLKTQFSSDREPLPDGFRPIHVNRYGPIRMQRSMRDLSWFLRYVTYAIVAGDSSILTVNVRGLRGVIPEDVTEATIVALREMRWRSLGYFKTDPEATTIIQENFDTLITEYRTEKPPTRFRQGVSDDQQGLQLPESYALSATFRPKFVMKRGLSITEQQQVIKAAYRQVFERDITREYGVALTDLESKFKSGDFSTKEFIRQLGKSRLYRREFYEPFVISRVIELAVRHFLGRGLSSREEFQAHFETISEGGLLALVNALVDSSEYSDYFGEETVPYLRGLGQEAQECRNWGPQFALFRYSAIAHKAPQFITLFGDYQKPLPNQHPYGLGNDPLEIQFGAIFPHQDRNFDDHPAGVSKDVRRILIGCEVSHANGHEIANGASHSVMASQATWGKVPGAIPRSLTLSVPSLGRPLGQGPSVNLVPYSPTSVIQAVYRQVFGRDVLAEQRVKTAELKFTGGEITVRELVRQLAKSREFRHLYWESLYITKSIEYIHRRLLGRPTYGRQEMAPYYDICARKGFYALIDALIDSPEYQATFGDDTVPYERYVTPRGFEMRFPVQTQSLHPVLTGDRVFERHWLTSTHQHSPLYPPEAHTNGSVLDESLTASQEQADYATP
jgi:phycobilisome core-membrane linker protein